MCYCCCFYFFFFQAEDGIRDLTVTGVQTCALPISQHLEEEGGTTAMAQAMKTAKAKTTLRPLHDRVLVKRLEEQDEKHGSLIIPDTAKEKPQEGKVVAVGTGKVNDDGKNFPLAVKKGDRILFGKYSGSEVKLDGEEYLIMKEEDVLGILGS